MAMNTHGESPHSIPSKLYQVPQASPRITERPVVGPHILSTDAISDTQIMLRWTVSTFRLFQLFCSRRPLIEQIGTLLF